MGLAIGSHTAHKWPRAQTTADHSSAIISAAAARVFFAMQWLASLALLLVQHVQQAQSAQAEVAAHEALRDLARSSTV